MTEVQRSFFDEDGGWLLRVVRNGVTHFQPYLGWLVLLGTMAVTAFPPLALRMIGGQGLPVGIYNLEIIGPLAVVATWLVLGWKRPWLDPAHSRGLRAAAAALFALLLLVPAGVLVVLQIVIGWIPGPAALWGAGRDATWPLLGERVLTDFTRMGNRYLLWWTGVQSGGAAQDNLVLVGILGLAIWLLGMLSAALARRTQRGLVASAPSLALIAITLLYTTRGRLVLVGVVAAALFLHLVLDQVTLRRRWEAQGLAYSPLVLLERLWAVIGIGLLLLALAAVVPSIGSERLAWWYYQRVQPANDQLERMTKRLFPDVRGGGGIFGSGVAGGLPNEFLITTGPQDQETEVMRVRTNELSRPDSAPPGHYMRSGTFSDYDGRGWDNPDRMIYREGEAGEPVLALAGAGRKVLIQNVFLSFNARVVYAAGEPVEPSIGYRAAFRAPGDLALLSAPARSYTVVSQIPAVADETLGAAPGWSRENPLPADYAVHLALPETITPRTRALADELTAELATPYAKAKAIEQYLRTIEYDLEVPLPSAEVVDITDYFLFDLRRGYCDYYATAFVVLARLSGLPTRFATGFVAGSWDARDVAFVITEAEAHSWPEVYFPDYGWIPFEPTGGRPELVRIETAAGLGNRVAPAATPAPLEVEAPVIPWNPQMLVWLVPILLMLFGGVVLVKRRQRSREDPWLGVLQWGAQAGRPMADAETTLEYGQELGELVRQRTTQLPDTARHAAREIIALSRDVTAAHYGVADVRAAAIERAATRWQTLRDSLRVLARRR